MTEQAESEAVKGTLRLELGGAARRIAVLPIRAADTWIELLQSKLTDTVGEASNDSGPLVSFARVTNHAAVELIVAYDRDGTLGGSEWLIEHASPEEVFDALEVLRVAALPFAPALRDAVMLVAETVARAKIAGLLAQQSSTNGRSPTGALPQDHLKPRSRTPNSTSSGRRVKSA